MTTVNDVRDFVSNALSNVTAAKRQAAALPRGARLYGDGVVDGTEAALQQVLAFLGDPETP